MNIQERLGYDQDDKLLIIHADDFGLCHSQNAATIQAIEVGCVNSVSLMPPCPWFYEAISYAKYRQGMDLGIHLTLTSEWTHYKWGPVSPQQEVSSLVNEEGHFYDSIECLLDRADLSEIEKEIRAQVDKVLRYNVQITHIDSHMMVLQKTPALLKILSQVGHDYQLPVLLTGEHSEMLIKDTATTAPHFHIDNLILATPEIYSKTALTYYYEYQLSNLAKGLNMILVHPAFDDLEMQGVCAFDRMEFGAKWRQQDFNFFTSDHCKKLIVDNDIKLVTWRSIKSSFL
jgi:chitin disaccharide deacetylase